MLTDRRERIQCYFALCLTIGEFCAGVWMLVYDGHVLALYLAVTYALRETTGGKHYHRILIDWIHVQRLRRTFEKAIKNHSMS